MASLPFAEKGGEFAKDGVSSSAQNRGRTTHSLLSPHLNLMVVVGLYSDENPGFT
jgi:hypothetical protein